MVEFCSICPIKGSCVGEVSARVEITRGNNSYKQIVPLVRVTFVDIDGLQSEPQSAAAGELDESQTDDLAAQLTQRVEACNGPSRKGCPALSNEALTLIAKNLVESPLNE